MPSPQWTRRDGKDETTKRQKSPQEKKALAYKKDHYVGKHHGFKYSEVKAKQRRAYRHRAARLLRSVIGGTLAHVEDREDSITREAIRKSVPAERLGRSCAPSLKDYVQSRATKRNTTTQPRSRAFIGRTILFGGWFAYVRRVLSQPCQSPQELRDFRQALGRGLLYALGRRPKLARQALAWVRKAERLHELIGWFAT